MEEVKPTYEDLLIRINEQELKIKGIEEDLAANKFVFNEIQKNTKEAAVLLFSLSINKEGDLFYSSISSAVDEIYGFDANEIATTASIVFEKIHPTDKKQVLDCLLQLQSDCFPLQLTYRYYHPVKGLVWHQMNATASIAIDATAVCHGIITDITLRIEAEQKMNKAKRLYLFISRINQIIVRAKDQEQLFKEVCTAAVELGKFKMAWIGMIDPATQNVIPVSIGGDDMGYFSVFKTVTTKANEETAQGPAGLAIRYEKHHVCNAIQDDPIMKPWKEEALKRGYLSVMALPIKKLDQVIGVFVIYAAEKNYFDNEEIRLLGRAAIDVNFALEVFVKETMRKQAEHAVVESEQRFHTLTEVSPVGIFRTDLSGATTYVNKRFTQIVGISFEQSMGNGWYLSIHPEDQVKLYNEWKKVTGERKRSILEYRFVKADGSIIWVIGQATPETDAENQIIGFIGTITDITQRKLAEEKFVKTNKKMEAIIEAIPDMMFEVNLKGIIFNYHSPSHNLLLVPPPSFIGKSVVDLLPPDAVAVCFSAIKEAHQKGVSRGKQYILELSGVKHWFELSIAPMRENLGRELHFIVISRDITEQKMADEALVRNKERYRGLLENLEAGIVVHAADGAIIKCNNKSTELLGYTIEELMQGNNELLKWDFLNEDYSEMLVENYPISQIIRSKKAIKNLTVGIRKQRKIETLTWVLVSGFPMFDANEDILEVVVSFIDVTEQKLMDYEIKKAKELAETASKSKTDFLANMSHEIRTPLNGIVGFTSLLMETDLEKKQQKYMLNINESAKNLMDIVNDILDFSKIEAGKLELKIEEVDLFALTNQLISLFKYQANKKQIDLVLHIAVAVPQFVFADSLRLKQIIINLIGNAIKFTPKGQICLTIDAILPIEADCVNLYFSVKDTGIGIQPNNQHKIFHSFVQEDNSTSRQFGGTGLGLSISNQLLELMDSKLELESTYGEGSLFYFYIRFQKSTMKYQLQQSKNDKETIVTIAGFKRVLIVEDNTINMLLAKVLVQKIIPDALIFEALDGDEAIEQYKKQSFDVILMDIQMPNKNGFEATYEIRKIEQNSFTPIIALTAGIFVEEKEECLKSGMNDYITKPIIISDLESVLKKWLENRLVVD